MGKHQGNWKQFISNEMDNHEDNWENVEFSTISEKDLLKEFDSGYGLEEGKPFTLWTKSRVYFPTCYDGAEWVSSVPRNPCNEITKHIGG